MVYYYQEIGGDFMDYSIQAEYGSLLAREQFIRVQLNELPIGYISKKTIKGNLQYYLQRRIGGKMTSVYIRADEVQNVREALERRAQYESEKEQIAARLEQLEQAAKLIGKNLYCKFMMMKLSVGMDDLDVEQRKLCSSFGAAMNAVEGVMISEETAAEIDRWHRKEESFQTVYENTLLRYGFPLEVTT